MAHQQNGGVGALPDGGADRVAEPLVGNRLVADTVVVEESANSVSDRIDSGLVVTAAVGVHHLFEQTEHGGSLLGEPIEKRPFACPRGSRHVIPPLAGIITMWRPVLPSKPALLPPARIERVA